MKRATIFYVLPLLFFLFSCAEKKGKELDNKENGQGLGEAQAKPNVVFILADDLGWKDLGCYGNGFIETPNLDKLAAQGLKLTQSYAACPVCSPTRASIMTGKYPAQLHLTNYIYGVRQPPNKPVLVPEYQKQLPLEEYTMAEMFKDAGYATGMVGKWHLAPSGTPTIYEPKYQGFDFQDGGRGSSRFYFYEEWIDDGRSDNIAGDSGDYITDNITDHALMWASKVKDKPFFLYLAHYAVHIPLEGTEDLIAKYQQKRERSGDTTFDPTYAAMVENMDMNIGKVMDSLDHWGLSENTILVFFSDNGGLVVPEGGTRPTDNSPLREGKGSLYEGGIREPCIVRFPAKVKAGTASDFSFSSIDFMPTFAEWCGIDHSDEKMDGVSHAKAFESPQDKDSDRPLFWHYPHYSNQHMWPGGAVLKGDYKLIERYATGKLELYNLAEDISESKNLAQENPEKTQELKDLLYAWRKEQKATMMPKNPDFDFSKFEGKPVTQ